MDIVYSIFLWTIPCLCDGENLGRGVGKSSKFVEYEKSNAKIENLTSPTNSESFRQVSSLARAFRMQF